MTTLAYDGKTLVTDSQMTCGSMLFGEGQKLFKLKNGSWVAMHGRMDLFLPCVLWLNGGEPPVIKNEDDEVGGIMVDKRGNAYEFDECFRLMPTCVPWAGGSGTPFAMTAMHLGKTAEEAVEISCKLDKNSGGALQKASIRGSR